MSHHFRIEIKTLSKASNQPAAAANRYDTRTVHPDKSDLVSVGNLHMPLWARADVSQFWSAADQHERANGLVARRAILSLPNALTPDLREQVVQEWLSTNCPNMPASWAIHDDPKADPANPHCHILISERLADGVDRAPELFFKRHNSKNPALGGCKKADIGSNRKDWLSSARKSWADILNKHLPADAQVSHLSNEVRGLPEPQPKFGPGVIAAEAKGIRTSLVSSVLEDAATFNRIRCLSFIDPASGRTVTRSSGIDKRDSVEIVGKLNRSKVIDLVAACREKGWVEVTLFGSDEFKAIARVELARAGIRIKGEDDEQNSKDDSGSGDRSGNGNSEVGGADCTRRPSAARSPDEPDRGSDSRHERSQPKTDRDAPELAGAAHHQYRRAEFGALDDLDDHRRNDITIISSSYGPSEKPAKTRVQGSSRGGGMQKDLTTIAVQNQLAAMRDASEFEVGILNAAGKMMTMRASAGQVLSQIPRLKKENACGSHIYIRPARNLYHPYVLMDDLSPAQLDQLKRDGFAAALTLQTSRNNHQVLLKLPASLDAKGRKQIERALQKRYGSDPNSADGQHFFRLAGFTNRKPKYQTLRDGKLHFPHVLVKHAASAPAMSASALEWLKIAPKVVDVPDEQPERVIEQAAPVRPQWHGKKGELAQSVSNSHLHLQVQYGQNYDPSKADFQIAKTLLRQGWHSDSVREGLRDGSPDLLSRKAGHVDDYLERTMSKVTGRPMHNQNVRDEQEPAP